MYGLVNTYRLIQKKWSRQYLSIGPNMYWSRRYLSIDELATPTLTPITLISVYLAHFNLALLLAY